MKITAPESLQSLFESTFAGISQVCASFIPKLTPREVGIITNVSTGIARVSGLPGVGFEELVKFPGEVFGIAFNLDEDEVGVVLLGEYADLHAGNEVERTGRVMDVAVGEGLLGRVIDPLGRPLDGKGAVNTSKRLPIERPAAPIMDRAPVTVPLQTGIIVVDALIPIGRGQRELILGDRQTGKTAIAIDAILNQRDNRPLSGALYEPVGQRLLPLDSQWQHGLAKVRWPTDNLPEVMGEKNATLRALIREYLFISLFKACAESLASENSSRLAAMERADQNINELLENLKATFHRLRQTSIDEELFEVIAGFEALNGSAPNS